MSRERVSRAITLCDSGAYDQCVTMRDMKRAALLMAGNVIWGFGEPEGTAHFRHGALARMGWIASHYPRDNDDAAGPVEADEAVVGAGLEMVEERCGLGGVILGPVGLRQHGHWFRVE